MIEYSAILDIYNKQFLKNEKEICEMLTLKKAGLIDGDTLEERLRTGFFKALVSLKQNTVEECSSRTISWSDDEWKHLSDEMMQQFRLKKIKGKYTKQYMLVPDEANLESAGAKKKASTPAQKLHEQEECIEQHLDYLEKYHLSDLSKSKLKGYFRYLMQRKVRNLQYNFIIQTDDVVTAKKFIQELYGIVGHLTGRNMKIYYSTEKNILNGVSVVPELTGHDVTVVSDLLEDRAYYANDYEESSSISKKNKYDDCWESCMNLFETYTQKTFILCGPERIIQNRIKNNQHMYYRFFRNSISIANMSADEIYQGIIVRLKPNMKWTDKFEQELKTYVDTMYPRSTLKNEDYINDVYAQIMTNAFEKKDNVRLTEKSIPFYNRNDSFENIESEFQSLVGLAEVKEKFREIGLLCQNIDSAAKAPNLHMVFRGNPGTGKTTVAKHVAKLLSSMGVIKNDKIIQVMASDLISVYLGQTGPKTRSAIRKAEGGVLFVDEAYLLNPNKNSRADEYREECLGELIKAMEKGSDPVIIFAGYPNEMDAFTKANPGFLSRIGFTLEFEDYDSNQLLKIFKNICKRNGYSFDDNTIEAVGRKITAAKYDDNFGNARTVENIFNQAVIESLKNGHKDRFIGADDIVIDKKHKNYEELMEELNEKVGLQSAKDVIKHQTESNKFCREAGIPQPSSNNMIFVGNAGTGKTTTAKMFAEMLFTIGVAKSPKTKIITARDLFVQDAAEKMSELFREAMGGVLFIDEIYLLQNSPYHCVEVVSVLLEKLEENREDITIILAGYEKQMELFLDENQGLASRFPITVHFDDFTEDELVSIFIQNCAQSGMTVNEDGLKKFRCIIKKEMSKDNFGNGRSVRNVFEQAFRNHAVNYYNNQHEGINVISADDIIELSAANEEIKFGFRAG